MDILDSEGSSTECRPGNLTGTAPSPPLNEESLERANRQPGMSRVRAIPGRPILGAVLWGYAGFAVGGAFFGGPGAAALGLTGFLLGFGFTRGTGLDIRILQTQFGPNRFLEMLDHLRIAVSHRLTPDLRRALEDFHRTVADLSETMKYSPGAARDLGDIGLYSTVMIYLPEMLNLHLRRPLVLDWVAAGEDPRHPARIAAEALRRTEAELRELIGELKDTASH